MRDCDIQDPIVSEIEAYGYPRWMLEVEPLFCEVCGEELVDPDETYEDEDHEHICESCLKLKHMKRW